MGGALCLVLYLLKGPGCDNMHWVGFFSLPKLPPAWNSQAISSKGFPTFSHKYSAPGLLIENWVPVSPMDHFACLEFY
jgi:hypothetical protein